MPVEPAPTSSKTIHHEKVLSMTPELRKEWAIMFLSEPFGSHIWSKDSNEFPFSSQGCINQSFSSWQVSSWFSSEKPSLSKYPKANHMGGRGIKKIQNRPRCSWNA